MSRERLVFLDFDGVLVPYRTENLKRRPALADPQCLANLQWLCSHGEASVVVTSQWRVGADFAKMRDIITKTWGCQVDVVGVTPHIDAKRGSEIDDYVQKVALPAGLRSFVVLDDECLLGAPEYVAVRHMKIADRQVGLTVLDAHVALAHLNLDSLFVPEYRS